MTKTNANFGDDLPESFVWMAPFQYFSFVMAIGYSLSVFGMCVRVPNVYADALRMLISSHFSSFLFFARSFLFIYLLYLFLLFSHIKCYMMARKKIHAFEKFQHIFTLALNIWLMPIWNGKPHSTKLHRSKRIAKRKEENLRFSYSIYPIWFGVKRGQHKKTAEDCLLVFFCLATTIFILNKFWPQSISMQLKKREK